MLRPTYSHVACWRCCLRWVYQECEDKLAFNIVDCILTTFYAIDFVMTAIVVRFDKVIKKKWTMMQAIMVLGMFFDMIFCKVHCLPATTAFSANSAS